MADSLGPIGSLAPRTILTPNTAATVADSLGSGSKLRKWAIDQFPAKITCGYTGYDDHMEDDPSDKDTWKEYAKDLKAIS